MKNINNRYSNIPEKILFFCLSIATALILVLGWFNWNSYKNSQRFSNRDFRLQQLSSIIIHFDEVLTMSARLAAASGDMQWEKRYLEFEIKLDSAIKEIRSISPEAFITKNAVLTDSANIKLVGFEHQAFSMIHEGDMDSAIKLLSSEEYEKQKVIYSEGINNIVKALRVQAQSQIEKQHQQGILSLTFFIVSVLMFSIVSVAGLRMMRRYLFKKKQVYKLLKKQNKKYMVLNKELQRAKKHTEESEEKLKIEKEFIEKILDTQLDTVFVFNPQNGKAIRWNKKFEELTGYTSLEISQMKAPESYYDSEDLSKAKTSIQTIIKEGVGIIELQLLCKNGKEIPTEYAISANYDAQGVSTELISIGRDITERKQARQVLQDSEKQLRELNATKDRLFSIIAHDLRSPFNHILGFSELLIENIKNYEVAESEKYLGLIYSSAKNTLNLLDNLLNWSRTQTGNLSIQPTRIILSSIIQEIIDRSNAAAIVKNITLIHHQSDEIEVYADNDLLRTVLRNLISNAIKFTKPGGNVNVFIISKQNHVEISISDNGVGINRETCKKLFDVSANITSNGTANEKGSGLGLVLCKEFVEKLGGNIWVESEEGKGSDFKFTLPLNKP